ncbi:uncharacterized protein LOC128270552 [Anopheles cruzii]|uniref:uncharacterized protein LOC128270552 n=1 Tax=Anopheles cruzii TaxID=68878 RepID=UPI0022EC682E|nr:uncharacterized protein LOC128270552 [Anopheles cruzii]
MSSSPTIKGHYDNRLNRHLVLISTICETVDDCLTRLEFTMEDFWKNVDEKISSLDAETSALWTVLETSAEKLAACKNNSSIDKDIIVIEHSAMLESTTADMISKQSNTNRQQYERDELNSIKNVKQQMRDNSAKIENIQRLLGDIGNMTKNTQSSVHIHRTDKNMKLDELKQRKENLDRIKLDGIDMINNFNNILDNASLLRNLSDS